MMPRLNVAQHSHSSPPTWPLFDDRRTGPLFIGRQQYRKLVVLLDADVLDGVDFSTWSKEGLLLGLLTLHVVKCLRYADDGPPVNAVTEKDVHMGDHVPGWAVLGPDIDGTGNRSVRISDGNQISDHGIMGNRPEIATAGTHTDAYADLDPTSASDRRRADALAALVASAIGADLFITKRQYLHSMSGAIAEGVSFLDVDEALAALGLYLRAQEIYVISRDPQGRGTHALNRGLWFWVGTRELLPSAWRWFAACVQHSAGEGNDDLTLLGQSVLQRVQRALQVRDDVHVWLNKPQNNDTADEVLSSLDVVLLLLMGAVDATARLAHSALGLTGNPYRIGWQNRGWLAKVASASTALGSLFQDTTDETNTLTILRLLRNAVHGEALQSLGVSTAGRGREKTMVRLPSSHEGELLGAFALLGGNSVWGIEQLVTGSMHADPGVLLEQLLSRTVLMLNKIMDATPVERLTHVSLQPSDSRPPSGPHSEPFEQVNRDSIRSQLAL